MKTNLFRSFAMAIFIIVLALTVGGVSVTIVHAQPNADIDIAVDEDFGDLNIYTMTETSKSANYIFTCIYDRLIEIDSNGNLVPSLATSWQTIPCLEPEGGEEPVNVNNYEWEDLVELWPEGVSNMSSYPSGFELVSDSDNLEFFDEPGQLILELELRDSVYYHDDSMFDADELKSFIYAAKACPLETLIYKQWQCVSEMDIVPFNKLRLHLDFSNVTYGYYDFLYSLTSPMASIGKVSTCNNDVYCGTGAYELVSCSPSNNVTLNAYSGWWNTNSVNVSSLYFKYTSINANNYTSYDVNIVSGQNYYTAIPFGNTISVPENPIILKNTSNNMPLANIIENVNFRDIVNGINSGMVFSSGDYWVCNTPQTQTNNLNYLDFSTVLCLNEGYSYYFTNKLSQYLGARDINITVNAVSLIDYENEYEYGNYTFAIEEVELESINSNYLQFYGLTGNSNADNIMNLAKKSANLYTYLNMQLQTQAFVYINQFAFNLGWNTREIVYGNSNTTGVITSNCFCPYGNAGRIDLRWVQ